MSSDGGSEHVPTRVCRRCSVQSQMAGDFCPSCGKSFVRRGASKRARWVILTVVALLVVGGAGAAVAAKVRSDRAARAEQDRASAAAERREEAEAAAERAAQKKKAAEDAERDERARLIKQMQKSITKDARKDAGDGMLDGPIFYTSCDPLGGGSVDDLTALTTTFECIAVNQKLDNGGARGYVYSSTMNWDEFSWSWRLGG